MGQGRGDNWEKGRFGNRRLGLGRIEATLNSGDSWLNVPLPALRFCVSAAAAAGQKCNGEEEEEEDKSGRNWEGREGGGGRQTGQKVLEFLGLPPGWFSEIAIPFFNRSLVFSFLLSFFCQPWKRITLAQGRGEWEE